MSGIPRLADPLIPKRPSLRACSEGRFYTVMDYSYSMVAKGLLERS